MNSETIDKVMNIIINIVLAIIVWGFVGYVFIEELCK
jgi:hypothetical protein